MVRRREMRKATGLIVKRGMTCSKPKAQKSEEIPKEHFDLVLGFVQSITASQIKARMINEEEGEEEKTSIEEDEEEGSPEFVIQHPNIFRDGPTLNLPRYPQNTPSGFPTNLPST